MINRDRLKQLRAKEDERFLKLHPKSGQMFKDGQAGAGVIDIYASKIIGSDTLEGISHVNLVPQKNNFPLTSDELKQIKIGSNYDYFIQIKSGKFQNELGSIDTTPSKFSDNLSNEASVQMIIYDLNTQQIIYSKNAYGISGNPDNNSRDVTFSKSSNDLTIGCLKKILKDLDEKSLQ